ncbi:MAG: hypothetical protein JWM28_1031 [Chitinophagaceae bacterium]|nr:hypothetical protein [Chitinophagaceae bacterium]
MLKKIHFLLPFIIISAIAHAQEIGYTTTDIGGEVQWYSAGGYTAGLHLAFNGAVHSGFQLRAGYNKVDRKDWGIHADETGGGAGGGIGYRYYFPFRPHQFFLGVRSDIWRLKIDWKDPLSSGTTKTWTLHPAAEAGYMFLINDMAFITPAISAGYISNLATDGADVGEGFTFSAGISVGVKF